MISAGFDSQSWYKHLFEYGINGDASTSGNGSDPDEELIPRLVTQLVLPLAAHSLQHAWNPHSRRSTAAAKAMLEDLLIYVPPEEAKLQARPNLSNVAKLVCLYSNDVGITTTASPALDIAALCLSSWPVAIFVQTVTSFCQHPRSLKPAATCQLTADLL